MSSNSISSQTRDKQNRTPAARSSDYDHVDADIKQDTPEDSINSVYILSKAIDNAPRDILYYSALRGEILAVLTERNNYTRGIQVDFTQCIDMSRTHANFLLKFYRLFEEFPRLMNCKSKKFFYKNLKTIRSVYENNVVYGKNRP